MKFGKTLPRNQVPEWSSSYINYKGLKKLIKEAAAEKRAGKEPDLAPFIFSLDRNIETVDDFFNKRLSEAQRRLKLLREKYEGHFDFSKMGENGVNGVNKEAKKGQDGKIDGYGMDRDEMSELLGALLELRSGLRKLQWYRDVNRKGFVKILKKCDKKTGANVQQDYLESKVLNKTFASTNILQSDTQTVNAWLSKVGGTESLGDLENRPPELANHPRLRHVSSGAAAGISLATVEKVDKSIRDDDASTLKTVLEHEKETEGAQLTQRLLLNLLQRAISSKALQCTDLLLGLVDSLEEEDDINGRNVIHRLVISIGRTKSMINTEGRQETTASTLHMPKLYITPAENPITSPPANNNNNMLECDGTLRLSPDDPSVKLLDFLLTNLRPNQRTALAARDSHGRFALHYAAQYGFIVICRLLIKYMRQWNQFDISDGIDSPYWQDNDGYAPLHLAVVNEHPKTTKTLLDAEHWGGNEDITDKILNARKTVSKSSLALIIASKKNCHKIVELLVEAGVDINYQDSEGDSALHHAARLGNTESLKVLLAGSDTQKAEVELMEKNYGWTPLFLAAVEGKMDVAVALVEEGSAEVDKLDISGWTATEHAALRGHLDLAHFLSSHSVLEATEEVTSVGSTSPTLGTSFEKTSTGSFTSPSITPKESKPVKSFGHRYLKNGDSMVVVTLGSMDTRKSIQAVKLDEIPVSEAHTTELDTALSLVVSAKNATGEAITIDLPVHSNVATDDPIVFQTKDAKNVKLLFDIVPTYAGSHDRPIGRAVAFLGSIKTGLGLNRASLQGGIQVPILAINTLEIIGTVNFEFLVVTPFDHVNMSVTREHTYWKTLSSPRVIGHRGLGKNFNTRKSLQLGENTLLSFITAAKLGASYIEFDVQLTKDHVPVIYHDFLVGETGIDAPVHTLTLEQFLSINADPSSSHGSSGKSTSTSTASITSSAIPQNGTDTDATTNGRTSPTSLRRARSMSVNGSDTRIDLGVDRMKHSKAFKRHGFKGNARGTSIQSPFATLADVFKHMPSDTGFNIELKYPMLQESEEEEMGASVIEMNAYVDAILQVVYDNFTSERNLIFSSFNPDVCLMLSFKQPSIPVLFLTEGGTASMADIRASSLQEAIRFASRWNLLGIVSAAGPFVLCPRLIRVVKESGLVCVSYGTLNNESRNVRRQWRQGVDAVIVDKVLAIGKELRPEEAAGLKVVEGKEVLVA